VSAPNWVSVTATICSSVRAPTAPAVIVAIWVVVSSAISVLVSP